MRLAFLGNDPWSVPALEALAASDHDVALVITNPPRPAGRGSRLTPTAVADAARRFGLPLAEPDGVNTGPGSAALEEVAPDVLVVVAYGELLAPSVLVLAPHGAVNLHFSLLPRWRGASPVQHALLAGDATTGVTVMLMDAGLDTGPILAQQAETVLDGEDAGSLGSRLADRGGRLLPRVLDAIDMGESEPREQDGAAATFAPKLTAADRQIDWSTGARAVVRRVRALAPTPGATTSFRGEPLKVLAAEVLQPGSVQDPGSAPAGSLGEMPDPNAPLVTTPDGHVLLVEVAPAGRKRMPAADWARGARIRSGERLG